MAGLFPFSNVGVDAIQAPVESLEVKGYLQGLEASKRTPTTATAIARGITEGIGNYNTQVEAGQRQQLNDLSIQQQQAQVARQPIINEAEQLKLEIAKLQAANAKATNDIEQKTTKAKLEADLKENTMKNELLTIKSEFLKDLSSENPDVVKESLNSRKNQGMFALEPALKDQAEDTIYKNGGFSEEEYQGILAKRNARKKEELANAERTENIKAYKKSKADFETSDTFKGLATELNLGSDSDAAAKMAATVVKVPVGKYIYEKDSEGQDTKKLKLDPKFTPSADDYYEFITTDGTKLNVAPIKKDEKNAYNDFSLNASKVGVIKKAATEADFTFLSKAVPDEKPAERGFAQRTAEFLGIMGHTNTAKPETTNTSAMKQLQEQTERRRREAESRRPSADPSPTPTPQVSSSPTPQGSPSPTATAQPTAQATPQATPRPNVAPSSNPVPSSVNPPGYRPVSIKQYTSDNPVVNTVLREPLLQGKSPIVRAIAAQESAGKRDATSPSGVKGLMQVQKDTAAWIGEITRGKPYDRDIPSENVAAGEAYLKYLNKTFDNNLPLVLGAYNGGQGTILTALSYSGKSKKDAEWSDIISGLEIMRVKQEIEGRKPKELKLTKEKIKEISEYPYKVMSLLSEFQDAEEVSTLMA